MNRSVRIVILGLVVPMLCIVSAGTDKSFKTTERHYGEPEAGKALVETYGVRVDQDIHEEVLARVEPLNIAPFKGFIQPRIVAVEENGEIVDVNIRHMGSDQR